MGKYLSPCTEGLPHDAPEPLGHHVTLSHYVDANLMHYASSIKQANMIRFLSDDVWTCETSHYVSCPLIDSCFFLRTPSDEKSDGFADCLLIKRRRKFAREFSTHSRVLNPANNQKNDQIFLQTDQQQKSYFSCLLTST